jgi:hypothetical protein
LLPKSGTSSLDDIKELQRQASAWLPHLRGKANCLDHGHGWALNHPLQKLYDDQIYMSMMMMIEPSRALRVFGDEAAEVGHKRTRDDASDSVKEDVLRLAKPAVARDLKRVCA